MKILELSKSYVERAYNNDYVQAIRNVDGVLFDDNKIKKVFRHGFGIKSDLMNYIKNNRQFCKYYDLENNCYI